VGNPHLASHLKDPEIFKSFERREISLLNVCNSRKKYRLAIGQVYNEFWRPRNSKTLLCGTCGKSLGGTFLFKQKKTCAAPLVENFSLRETSPVGGWPVWRDRGGAGKGCLETSHHFLPLKK